MKLLLSICSKDKAKHNAGVSEVWFHFGEVVYEFSSSFDPKDLVVKSIGKKI